jgi:hypothetical protein
MNHPGVWITTIMAASILMITMGTRQSMGLYVGPLNTDTGLGIVSICLCPHHWQTDSVGRLDEHHVGHGRCGLAGHSIAQPPHQ